MTGQARTDAPLGAGKARRVCFIAESQVGIGSVARTLKPLALASTEPTIDWVDVTYVSEGGWLERLPLPRGVSGTTRGFLQTRSGLKRGPFDALLFLTQNPAVLHPRAIGRTPTLLWTDVTPVQLDELAEHYQHARDKNPITAMIKKEAVRHAFRSARRCVGWSEWVRRSLQSDYGVPYERTAVVPPGLDFTRWVAPDRAPRRAGDRLRLLFVGGDFRRKGGDLLLDVFRSRLSDRCELDVVTREPVDATPGVTVHHGLTAGSENLLELYRKADLFVLPTRADCQPVAAMEAMAMGLPVVTTRIGANSEVVEDGASGWLVEPDDGQRLGELLSNLSEDPAALNAFGQAGLRSARARFDAKTILATLLRLSLS